MQIIEGRYYTDYIDDDGCKIRKHNGGAISYFDNKKRYHRLDGPATTYSFDYTDGRSSTPKWFYHGQYIDCKSQEEFDRIIRLKAFW